jgi:hypothetical protein
MLCPTSIACALLVMLSACADKKEEPPVRTHDPVPTPRLSSILSVPIDVDTNAVRRAVEAALPMQLWTIDQHSKRCVKPQEVKLFGKKLKVTPPISCTIRGVVSRGPIRLRGAGRDILVDVPIHAKIGAYDVGGILKGETANGEALAHARIRLSLTPNWSPAARVRLDYDWVAAPGIDFLGQRITFAEKADTRLGPIITDLERSLPRELAKMNVRKQVDALWQQGFTSIMLNRHKPPVWMRLTPQKLRYGGYEMHGQRLRLNLGLDALTETFVGPKPDAPTLIPLPPMERASAENQLRFHIPVVADYAELEPVILRALRKRARRPFDLPGIGPVSVKFDNVVAYGTVGEKIAVGVTLAITPKAISLGRTSGVIWLVARPVTTPNSAKVRFEALDIAGSTDAVSGDLLIALGRSGAFSEAIAASLTQNFSNDLSKLVEKIRRAIQNKQTGQFVIEAKMDRIATGRIMAYGQGLYLPVDVEGTASVTFRPKP